MLLVYLIMMLGIVDLVFINFEYGVEEYFVVIIGMLIILVINIFVVQGACFILMWIIGILIVVFMVGIFMGEIESMGWVVFILILVVFFIFVFCGQYCQERDKVIYLYILEEKEVWIVKQWEELEEVNINLVGFNFVIIYDLKGVLWCVQFFVQLVECRLFVEVKVEVGDLFEMIKQNYDKIQEIIEGFMFLNKIGKINFEQEVVDLDEVLIKVWKELEFDFVKGWKIEYRKGKFGKVAGDEGLIWYIFYNLFFNVVKYFEKEELFNIEVGIYQDRGE